MDTETKLRDGTYSAKGVYEVHIGPKSINVEVTLKDGVITDSTVIGEADDDTSKLHQKMFIDGYKGLVLGKKITEVNLSKVSGSSLTSAGFNSALRNIEEQAKP